MDFGAVETTLGFKLSHVIAGLMGGGVRALIVGGGFPAAMTSAGVGCATAAYATSPLYFALVRYMPVLKDPSTEHAAGFVVGLCGLIICEGVMRYAKQRLEKTTGPSDAGFTTSPPAYVPHSPTPKTGE